MKKILQIDFERRVAYSVLSKYKDIYLYRPQCRRKFKTCNVCSLNFDMHLLLTYLVLTLNYLTVPYDILKLAG